MLYRLDYHDGDREAVRDPMMIGSDLITRHMSTARGRASEEARESGRAILITRIGKAGAMKPSLIVEPSGKCRRPDGTKATGQGCSRASGKACFCPACRAERKVRR